MVGASRSPSCKPTYVFRLGGLIYFKVFNQDIILVNSVEIAMDLLDKRSRIYSDRPQVPMVEMTGWDFNLATMPYGEKWRAHRRMIHQKFRPQAALSFLPIQLNATHSLLRDLLDTPDEFIQAVRT